MIVTRTLSKMYGRVPVVDGVDLDVRPGDRYGLLGPNRSGKTTLVRMLLGLVFATRGEIEVLGKKVPSRIQEILPSVGALVDGPGLYPHLSGRTNLRLIDAAGRSTSKRRQHTRIGEALERVGLSGIDDRAVKTYSLGMKQRLGLAAAILRRPQLLILDEPTNGLDPRGVRDVRDLLTELNEDGTTVFLSSHLLGDIELFCNRIGVMDRGRLTVQDTMSSLRRPTGRVLLRTREPDRAVALLDGRVEDRDGDHLTIRYDDPAQLNTWLVSAGIAVSELTVERRSLEQVVLDAIATGADKVEAP